MSPFDAQFKITYNKNLDGSWDVTRAKFNCYGIGFGQSGYWGNRHFPTLEIARQEFEKYLAETRAIYGKGNGRDWTGRFDEVQIPLAGMLVDGRKFYPLKKNGKRGVRVHTVHLYRIKVTDAEKQAIRAALPHLTIE